MFLRSNFILFFNDKALLNYSGVIGGFLALNRAKTAFVAADAAHVAADASRDASRDALGVSFRAASDASYAALGAASYVVALGASYDAADNTSKAARETSKAARGAYDAANNTYKAACETSKAARGAYDAADAALNTARERAKLFKPFESKTDAVLSALSIASAPICLALLAFDEMVSFIVYSLKSIASLVTSGPSAAKEPGTEAVNHLLEAFKSLLAAIVSPVVNTVDFSGCIFTTLITTTPGNEQEQYTQGAEGDIYTSSPLV
jgi:hypothetical protein